jgi:hypothetical protein
MTTHVTTRNPVRSDVPAAPAEETTADTPDTTTRTWALARESAGSGVRAGRVTTSLRGHDRRG